MSGPPQDEPTFDGELLAERYRLGPRLGRGGQATTHLALDVESGDHVAIKSFDLSDVEDWKELELFERESRVLSELDHPGIPRFLDQIRDEENGRFHLVMAHVPGQSLREVVRRLGPMSEEALWDVLFQTVEVLSYLHRRVPPIVHRDVKPSNLVQSPDGALSLVDFGGVRDATREEGGSTMVGTFGYMAPEQLHGDAQPATDLYALGATLIHLGTGIEPEKLPRKKMRIDFDEKLKVSDDLKRVLRRLTEPDPDHRPKSAVALLDELQSGAIAPPSAEDAETSLDEHAPPPAPPMPPDLPWPMAMVLGILLRVVSLMGRLALGVAEYIIIPLVFLVLGLFATKPELMREKEAQAKEAARRARTALKEMAVRGRRELREARRWARSEERRQRRRNPEIAGRAADLRAYEERVRARRRHFERVHSRSRNRKPQKEQAESRRR